MAGGRHQLQRQVLHPMKRSIWYEMGMRDGVFRGTVPAAFMNAAYRFFLTLRDQCRMNVYDSYRPSASETAFVFNARDKFGNWRGFDYRMFRDKFTFQAPPLGSPIPEELWTTGRPEWTKISFSEEELLGEEIIPHPYNADNTGRAIGRLSMSMQWETQRYKLIQKMRWCIIPLKVSVRYSHYNDWWREWYGNRACIDYNFPWEIYPQIKVSFSDYWTQEDTVYKIGIYAKKLHPDYRTPIEGCYWVKDKTFTTPPWPPDQRWFGESSLRIYGAVDLSTHPDYQHYFDLIEEESVI